jgi:FtsP/CotA-like multicopper oxidase with cupredoxin domain
MNDTAVVKFQVTPGKTYLFRMINIGAFAAHHVWIEGHDMTIVEVDGAYTQPATTNLIYIAVAQRYAVLVTAKNSTSANFPIVGAMDQVSTHFGMICGALTGEGPVRQPARQAAAKRHWMAPVRCHEDVPRRSVPGRIQRF